MVDLGEGLGACLQLVEPRPAPQAAALRPELYQQLQREPRGFLAIRALARP